MKTITEQDRERFRAMGRKGGATRAKSFTSKYQKAIRAHVSHESCVANGRKGAAVLAAKRAKQTRQLDTAPVIYGGTESRTDEPGDDVTQVQPLPLTPCSPS